MNDQQSLILSCIEERMGCSGHKVVGWWVRRHDRGEDGRERGVDVESGDG